MSITMSFYGFCLLKELSNDEARAFKIWLGSLRESMLSVAAWEGLWEEFCG